MTENAVADEVKRLGELFKTSFPDVGCLRCGNGDFYILPATREGFWASSHDAPLFLDVATLACTRRGHIERHLTESLEKASKLIAIVGKIAS